MEALLSTENLTKYFNTPQGLLHAVDKINLSVSGSKTLGVVGESGCGKSTLGRMLVNLIKPSSGQIFFEGNKITGLKKKAHRDLRKHMQIIFQDPYASLDPRMSVRQIISEPLVVFSEGDRQSIHSRVSKLMEVVGLSRRMENHYPHELDGGRRQRIGIARALALNPKFIVCDEPVSALDVSIQAQILNLLMDLQDELKLTYLFIAHDLAVVKHISHEIMVMYLGQCVERANKEELFANPQHPYTKALLKSILNLDINNNLLQQEIIKGEVTSPIDPVPGCRFSPRCAYYTEECSAGDIPLIETNPGHYVACTLYKPSKDKEEKR